MAISRERLRQYRRNAQNLCSVARCKRTIDRGGRCEKHADEDREAATARYHARRGKVAPRKCGKCGFPGHNSRRCKAVS